jgi:zinc protease
MKNKNHHSLPGPADIHRHQTANGITIVSRANFNSPSVIISGYLPAGSLFDEDDLLGLADFTAMMLTRGTRTRDFHSIHDALESSGANLGISAGAHTASFNGRCLAEDLPLLLDLLAESLTQPSFDSKQMEKLRVQLLTGLSIRAQDTTEMASLTFDKILFDGHPYSRPEDGYPDTIQKITRKNLADFHKKHYGPNGMVISIVGGMDPEEAFPQVHRVLGDWHNDSQSSEFELPPYSPMERSKTRHIHIPGKSQSDIVIGSNGPKRLDPEYLPASLGNSVLGQFGMMGRIGDVVREKSGLAYYAYSSLNAGIGPGSWEISAGVNPTNVRKATDLIKTEINRFVTKGVTKEELADSQANFIGRLPLSLESNAGVAGALLNIERFNLGSEYYLRYPEKVREVTSDAVLAAIQKFLDPEKLAIAIAGPKLR